MAKPSLDEETTKKVIRQVEFYFSDSNLPRDDFLRKTVTESEDGMVSLALICSFNRMRKHLNLGDVKADDVKEDTVKAVAEVLKNAASLKISEDGKKVGRITELPKPEEVIEQVEIRTIAASPFEYNVKLEEVESFFGQLAKINSVRLPRHVGDKRFFCGTALIEFSSDEEMQNVLKQKLVYAGAELELKPKKDFDAEREKDLEKHEKCRKSVDASHEDNTNTEPSYPKGLLIAFKLKSNSAEVPSEKNSTDEQANGTNGVTKTDQQNPSEVAAEESDQKMSENDDNDNDKENNGVNEGKEAEVEEKVQENNGVKEIKETEAEEKDQENNGVTEGEEKSKESEVKRSAASYKDNSDVVLREDLKVVFEKFGDVKYIDFVMGAESGFIRFDEPEAAQKARAAAVLSEKGGLVVKNYIAVLDPVTGEAEREYWSLLRGNQEKRREDMNNRGRGGRHGGRGGKHSRHRDNDFGGGRQNKFRKY
ncbi:la protein 1 [Cicer arietinum]|uniref:La protein 1 n=1 Tax=Cicer arietinum TaxID=3827 RepID=A0A1S2Y423_CICAR|nr:la protein 1 [Cicer arietinum]